MGDIGSEVAPRQRRAEEFGQRANVQAPVKDAQRQSSKDRQQSARNPAWLVLEILFVTILVFFWL